MTKVILSEEEFLATFNVGDRFWHMTTMVGLGPMGIEGPVVIEAFDQYDFEGVDLARIQHTVNIDGVDCPQWTCVSEFANDFNGVFLSMAEGEEYFQARRHAYETDPDLILRLKRQREACETFCLIMQSAADKQDQPMN